jgi:hypothetical protein
VVATQSKTPGMATAFAPDDELPKGATVAKLLGHAAYLVESGAFKGSQAALLVFWYLCQHPGAAFATADKWKNANGCVVDSYHAAPGQISKGCAVGDAYNALEKLRQRKLIRGGPGDTGPLTIASVNRRTENARQAALVPKTAIEQLPDSTVSTNPRLSRKSKRRIVKG